MTTKPVASLTDRDLITSLSSTLCPACSGLKRERQTICQRDYKRLNTGQRAALYGRLGEGYEQAVADAFKTLGRDTFYLPTAAPR